MKQKFFFFLLAFCLMKGCVVDYDMKSINIDEPNRIVVNSLLNPQKPISVRFFTIDRTDSGFVYNRAENLHVKLTEDGKTLFDGVCADTALVLEHRPNAKSRYRIDVSLSGYTPVWAETTIPSAITCKARAEEFNLSEWGGSSTKEMKYYLSDFSTEYLQENSSLYVVAFGVANGDSLVQCYNLYASNVFLDPINRTNGIEVKDKDVGSSVYDLFMRIKNRNLPHLNNLIFVSLMPPDGYYEPFEIDYNDPWSYWDHEWTWIAYDDYYYLVKLVTAGPDYDMYYRTYYQQTSYMVYDDDISAMFYQPVQVYSNINGGLGIFAGLNESNYTFDVPEE